MLDTVTVRTGKCIVCGEEGEVKVLAADLDRWKSTGCFVHEAFPEMPPAQREMLISGTHPDCWDTLWPEEE